MTRINYHHLFYFWHVASEGNLTRVAEQLHVSQSALSAQIRKLEEATGMRLFERAGRSMTLTLEGRQMLRYAQDIFTRGEELEAWLRSGGGSGTTQIRIGIISTLSRNFIDRLIAPVLEDPNIHLVLEAGTLEVLLRGLAKHQLDVVLTNGDVRGGDEQLWESRLLARQPISIVGPPRKGRRPSFPGGFKDMRWVLPGRDSEVRRAFEAFCSAHDYEPLVAAEANDMPMLRLLARDSGAMSVLPPVVVGDELQRGALAEYLQLPDVFENFYAITVKRSQPSPIINRLLAQRDEDLGSLSATL
ncbi:MAG: LysR family transcriptional regulator [Halieaceae bacterium]|jgi:LysR family transcriptional activator of nhaA|nr:LysR family transcriptional regulator [Halieaceae bacterium]